MTDRVLAMLNGLVRSPGFQLLVCGVLLALAFPARSSGAIGLSIIGGALGVGVALLWPQAPAYLRTPPGDVTSALVVTIVIAAGLTTFWDTLTVSPDWQMGDWGPHHAVIANIMPSMPGFDTAGVEPRAVDGGCATRAVSGSRTSRRALSRSGARR